MALTYEQLLAEAMVPPVSKEKGTDTYAARLPDEPTEADRAAAARFAQNLIDTGVNWTEAYIQTFPKKDHKNRRAAQNASFYYARLPHVKAAIRDLATLVAAQMRDSETDAKRILNAAMKANLLDLFEEDWSVKPPSELRKMPIELQRVIHEIGVDEVETRDPESGKVTIKRKVKVKHIDKLKSIELLAKLMGWLDAEEERASVTVTDLIVDSKLIERPTVEELMLKAEERVNAQAGREENSRAPASTSDREAEPGPSDREKRVGSAGHGGDREGPAGGGE